MCGIAGMFGRPNPIAVRSMVTAMHHRGPDDSGLYADDVAALAQARLAIIDTTAGGHQPMASSDGLIQIVYNGETYNFRAERAFLESKGYCFKSASDTEVLLKLYEEYGDSFLTRLRGIFALAIYDKRGGPGKERMLLARDQFGVKPLLYSRINEGVVFASELKALLASGLVSRRVDSEALQQLLSLGSVYQPKTLLEGVFSLPSAHYMVVDCQGVHVQRYWSFELDRIAGVRRLPYAEQVDAFASALTESVRMQMVADVPVGAFLSGGVDSSLIVALMAREAGGHIKTYSVGFDQAVSLDDESHEAAEIATLLETDHTRVIVSAADMAAQVERFVVGLDQPSVDGFNSYFVSQAASAGVTVSLSGTGGDELFLGYPWFANVQHSIDALSTAGSSKYWRLLRPLSWGNRPQKKGPSTAPDAAAFRELFGRQYHCFGPAEAHGLLSMHRGIGRGARSFAEDLALCDELPQAEWLDRSSVMCLNGYTRNQLLRDIDACSMTHSLEVRVPFLDVNIADFAFSLPITSKLAMTKRTLDPWASYTESGVKRIVCDVARKYLPKTFFEARAKRGFGLPYEAGMRGPLAELLNDTLSSDNVSKAALFDPTAVEAVLSEFTAGRRPWAHPWLLMITQLWHQEVLRA